MQGLVVAGCKFEDVGGNGLVISGFGRSVRIENNTFVRFGAAAIAVLGRTKLIDATGGDFPVGTLISRNIAYDGGIYLKGYFGPLVLAKQQASVVRGNVFFNSPRALIMVNDGAMGGDVIELNLLFNGTARRSTPSARDPLLKVWSSVTETPVAICCTANRETQDTGAIYTYDRLVFEFIGKDGVPTVVPQTRMIRNNMIFANYGCAWPLGTLQGS